MHNTLIVADDVAPFSETALSVLTFQDYLAEFPKLNEPKIRVINLCDTTRYLSQGYYCSLLAQARNHLVLPGVNTINDLRLAEARSVDRLPFALSLPVDEIDIPTAPLLVLFGEVKDQRFKRVARQAFEKYPCPILLLTLSVSDSRADKKEGKKVSGKHNVVGFADIAAKPFTALDSKQQQQCIAQLENYTTKQWRASKVSKLSLIHI